MNINKYKNPDDIRDFQDFFVELNAQEIQILCNFIKYFRAKGEIKNLEIINCLIDNLYEKLSDFDNHYDTDKTYIQHYTGWGEKMSKLEFMSLCGKYLIDVNIALENDNIREALINKDDEKVKELLLNEF